MDNTAKTRAIAYIRVSTDKQADAGYSLDSQRERVQAYANAMNIELVGIIEDPGQSAKTLDRPGLRQALKALSTRTADALLVVKLDRLTRSVSNLSFLLEKYFTGKGCSDLISMGESIDTRTASGRLMLNMLTSISQWEREAIGERTKAAMAEMSRQGLYVGGKAPFGYSLAEDGSLVENEVEQNTIRQVLAFKNQDMSLRQIAEQCRKVGSTSRNGRALSASTVKKILQTA